MINPSDINLSGLPWVPLKATSGFPEDPAIYFAIDSQGVVQYIGRSVNVRQRWKNHHRFDDLSAIDGVRIAYLFVDSPDLLPEIEAALISWFDPPLNVLHPFTVEEVRQGRIIIRLKEVREARGFSQNGLARALEMSLANLQKIEYGKAKSIPLDTLEKLCLTLDCEISDLLVLVRES